MPDETMALNKDLSQETEALLQEVQSKIAFSTPTECIQLLLNLEKSTRHAGDSASSTRLLIKIAEIAFLSKDPQFIHDQLLTASKKRGQFKSAIVKMIQRAIELASSSADCPDPIRTMKEIISLTEGKIYLEVERARVTKLLATLLFQAGQVKEAMEFMLELPIETFGSMEKLEKVEIIIDQLKLAISNGELSKASIIIKKISPQTFQDPAFESLRQDFFSLKRTMDIYNEAYLEAVADCTEIALHQPNSLSQRERVRFLEEAVFFSLLASFDCKQQEALMKLKQQKELIDHSPKTIQLIECFTQQNMIPFQQWIGEYQEFLLQFPQVFSLSEAEGKKRWNSLCDKLIEHNLRIIAKYYSEISMARLVDLLKCNQQKVEELLCALVVQKAVYARINRPAGLVTFDRELQPEQVLDIWSARLGEISELLIKTSHLVAKEEILLRK
jgi:26S proteasome regulatory subunit N5